MPFFDFHCHPALKPQFSDPADPSSPWDFLDAEVEILGMDIGINGLFNEVLSSQSCLSQMFDAQVKLFGLVLHAPEQNMALNLLKKGIVNKGRLNLINTERARYIATGTHYFELINQELAHIQKTLSSTSLKGAQLKILNKASEFDENNPDNIYGVLIIEGLHCFMGDPNIPGVRDDFKRNFETFTNTNKVIAINVCHMQQNPFCNHAHGIQFFTPADFYPTGSGITEWGIEVIKQMTARNILVDIKHMSLFSRMQLYNSLSDGNTGFTQPIICTHAGVTGISRNDRVKYLYTRPVQTGPVYEIAYLKPASSLIKGVYFNCSSINLYDEDIETILLSGGLIGLSFDQRILGFADENMIREVTIPHDIEYISGLEANFFLGPNPTKLPVWADDDVIWSSDDFANLDPSLDFDLLLKFFLNNVFHILSVAKRNPNIGVTKAMKQICLGTDFDGLIHAIDNCKQTNHLQTYKALLKEMAPPLFNEAGFGKDTISSEDLLENIFYNNGKNFMLERLAI